MTPVIVPFVACTVALVSTGALNVPPVAVPAIVALETVFPESRPPEICPAVPLMVTPVIVPFVACTVALVRTGALNVPPVTVPETVTLLAWRVPVVRVVPLRVLSPAMVCDVDRLTKFARAGVAAGNVFVLALSPMVWTSWSATKPRTGAGSPLAGTRTVTREIPVVLVARVIVPQAPDRLAAMAPSSWVRRLTELVAGIPGTTDVGNSQVDAWLQRLEATAPVPPAGIRICVSEAVTFVTHVRVDPLTVIVAPLVGVAETETVAVMSDAPRAGWQEGSQATAASRKMARRRGVVMVRGR